MPYGTFGFFGEALNIQNITEADIVQTVNLPIARTEGNLGDVVVNHSSLLFRTCYHCILHVWCVTCCAFYRFHLL